MSSLLADTSAYSAFMAGHEAIRLALQRAESIFLTPVVIAELRVGFLGGSRRAENERVLERFLQPSRVRVAGIDAETAVRYAEIFQYLRRQGRPVPTNDLWIAASAMQLGLRILTTDAHFQRIPQVIVDYHPIGA
ncbi:MAG: type II toxin-antitoxin system VapC family toxin [Bryobacterales bacterium]